ncbi:YhgE/Pip domain-containing protein [Enterococcus cecorum]|uniref:YhgE/Pip domain-containing protein n=1 Tax=Enterococcus cecorum TaxID=44008 RepID=UPI001FAE34B3|nr:YhgE/Pip domain-containing protein [Enterococcus cecorum]MCJ0557132.1 YhgE/Pip domain-containing protein [Enterococcus cecorum]MCJ0561268.1 YhgE/Pip domain-containing protein [Enterococcus cecorum]
MIKKEFQKIWANKLLFATVIVAMCLPILYASIFLKSIWDPYGRVNHLPVAVVNLDQPTTLEGNKVDVGDKLVKELKSNDDLDWHFVSAKKAQEGLKDRKYYMIVKIPKNFSENAASVLDTDPEKMDLTYETNGGLNFLGEVISENAMTQLKAKVSESVTKSYADVIIKMVKTVGDGMEQAADGATKLADGSKQVADGIATVQGKVPELSSGVKQLDDGGKQLADGVKQYTDGAGQAAKGSDQLAAGLQQLNGKVPTLVGGVNQLADGGKALNTGVNQYTAGVKQAYLGSGDLSDGLQKLQGNLPEIIAGVNKLADGSNKLAKQLQDGTREFGDEQAKQLKLYVKGVEDYINTINAVLPTLNNLPLDQLGQLKGQFATVQADLQSAGASLAAAGQTLQTSPAQVASNVVSQLPTDANGNVTVPAQQLAQLIGQQVGANNQQIGAQVTAAGNSLQNVGATLTQVGQLMNNLPSVDTSKIGELSTATSQLAANTDQATAGLNKLIDGTLEVKKKAVPGAQEIAGGIAAIQSNIPALTGGAKQLTDGAKSLNSGLKTLNSKSTELVNGSNKLNNGLGLMQGQLPALASGANQLADGSKQLNAGMKELTANSAKLNSGASQLSDGLNTLNGQIPALADGVNKLADGSTQVKDGNKELADKLGEASDKLTDVKLTNNTAKMIADPTKTKQEKYSDVPNYGHALAPYFMSVSLFVGCLVFNFVYPIRKIADRKNSNATQWFMSKLTVGFITSSMMALIIGTVMRMIGLEVAQPMNFYMTLLVTAWLFMFMIMFLAMSFDNPGRFIAVLLLVMQLGSSGGVFPMPLISKFYNVLNPFMPMTYSIYSLRQAISTGLGDEFYRNSMLILVILAIVFIILLGISMQILYRKGLAGYSQLHENQKLLDDDYTGKFAKEEDPYTLW